LISYGRDAGIITGNPQRSPAHSHVGHQHGLTGNAPSNNDGAIGSDESINGTKNVFAGKGGGGGLIRKGPRVAKNKTTTRHVTIGYNGVMGIKAEKELGPVPENHQTAEAPDYQLCAAET